MLTSTNVDWPNHTCSCLNETVAPQCSLVIFLFKAQITNTPLKYFQEQLLQWHTFNFNSFVCFSGAYGYRLSMCKNRKKRQNRTDVNYCNRRHIKIVTQKRHRCNVVDDEIFTRVNQFFNRQTRSNVPSILPPLTTTTTREITSLTYSELVLVRSVLSGDDTI